MNLSELKRVRIKVKGIVQGVGFRPTTYRYAIDLGLAGFVMNTAEGVTIEAEGPLDVLKVFLKKMQEQPPRLARITGFLIEYIEPVYETGFSIVTSREHGIKEADISPDVAVCKDCLSDILDKKNRRYLYPFTNCTNCGPRFSIIQDRPYDRAKTSMSVFKMCSDCEAEYNNPNNRRFHAQPNACHKCGPELALFDLNGVLHKGSKALNSFIEKIKKGDICAIKSIGGFNIVCDPTNMETMARLRKLKDRPSKSFAMMMRDMSVIRNLCIVSEIEEGFLNSIEAPILILRKKNMSLNHVSPDNNYYGVMLPYSPLHHILLQSFDYLVMTSANRRDEPIAIRDEDVHCMLKEGLVDSVLTNNRQIINRCDDSIMMVVDNEAMMLRRARGYVPSTIKVYNTLNSDNLSLGADLKNTFAIKINNNAYLSQYIGDLQDDRNYEYQKEQINIFTKLFNFIPEIINTDAHPLYQNNSDSYKKIYHHHAHAVSVMAEHKLLGQDIFAVVCDGTGFGTDGKIWGFEFLEIEKDYRNFKRLAHLKYFYLPGGEKAVIEIERIARALKGEPIETTINCPLTSSLGRLFDGVASICGLLDKVNYEAQAAILLQKHAEKFNNGDFKSPEYRVVWENNELDYVVIVQDILKDLADRVGVEEISYKFHVWVVDAVYSGINSFANGKKVVFSGGCFQNNLLCALLRKKLKDNGLNDFYFNNIVPTNDGGISLGQAVF